MVNGMLKKLKALKSDPRALKVYGGMAGAFLFIVLLAFSCGPRQGTMLYGVCRTFLEMYVPYPNTLRYVGVEEYVKVGKVRIDFAHIDASGSFSINMMECAFLQDPLRGLQLEKVEVNRKLVDPAEVTVFNPSIPAIAASQPDLALPSHIPGFLEKFEY